MTPGAPAVDEQELSAARWRLLAASDAGDARAFGEEFAAVETALGATGAPCWDAWAQAFAARAALDGGDADGASHSVTAARADLERCPPTAERALTLAYLAHVEVATDRLDSALHLAVDASRLADQVPGVAPSRELDQAHGWPSPALTLLGLE